MLGSQYTPLLQHRWILKNTVFGFEEEKEVNQTEQMDRIKNTTAASWHTSQQYTRVAATPHSTLRAGKRTMAKTAQVPGGTIGGGCDRSAAFKSVTIATMAKILRRVQIPKHSLGPLVLTTFSCWDVYFSK